LLLDGGSQKGTARAAISCRKTENVLNLPHEKSVLSACEIVGRHFDGPFATKKADEKILLAGIA
jgi:hypothetical protein